MILEEKYMQRCLSLAEKGLGHVAPNPLVGCVVVHDDAVLGEGYHEEFGQAHAEVNAIESVSDKSLLENSTLYVSLEPCTHHGKTPPCVDLIIKHKIPRVVVGCTDPFEEVNGKGIKKLRSAGIEVTVGVLEKECREMNRRFFTYHEKFRPYIILKWAQSSDGFVDALRAPDEPRAIISGPDSLKLSHQWRCEEQAILVGTQTALNDNPFLTARLFTGKNPLRVLLDRELKVPADFHLLDGSVPTLVFNLQKSGVEGNTEYVRIDAGSDELKPVLAELYKRNIQSLIVEGGSKLLGTFILQGLWDEARVFISPAKLVNGIMAPHIHGKHISTVDVNGDELKTVVFG
jgi:diaminohydroxyphosphoribosylaminopyrimidine deaminase/5-amino-6-(5-phosphoribosylamino)uracil reductase